MEELDIDQLKSEADQLGVKYNPQIGAAKLKEKIDAHYESQETSGKEIQAAVVAKEKSEEKPVVSGKETVVQRARRQYNEAKKTRVVRITDNDQRVNSQTTMAVVNWSNQFFDLGTTKIPLGVPVEIYQGYIDQLKGVCIPHHTIGKNGLAEVTMRPRYSISYEDQLVK